ncbi:MAG: alanine transaminase [candidate division NC10 bacterium]|nr:alanine transaminase [candidate division NC10 bacterium]
MEEFHRISRLPPYVFNIVTELKVEARARGEDIIDFGMGNPDLPTPPHIVEKLCEAARNPRNHRYSASRGITKLRSAIADWYGRRYGVEIDPEREAIATIGAKEGLSHLALAVVEPGDVALVPSPTYPIHPYSVIIAGGDVRSVRLEEGVDFYEALIAAHREIWPPPKLLILSFPHNPTTATVDLEFFEKVVAFAQEHHLILIHDLAYADLTFDGYQAPSLLQVPGAKEIGVEFFTLSKSYNMPGWRVGFCVGNPRIIAALTRLKSYLDYGMFQPIQIAAIIALNGPQACVGQTVETYRTRRDVLVDGLNRIGWNLSKPKGTMFVWAKIPESYLAMGSLEFSKFLLDKAKVAVSPGIGFGQYGDAYVRFALVENEHRTRQAIHGLKRVL